MPAIDISQKPEYTGVIENEQLLIPVIDMNEASGSRQKKLPANKLAAKLLEDIVTTDLKGDKGDPGIQGIQGVKGDAGIQGVKGDSGTAGVAGTSGWSPIISIKTYLERRVIQVVDWTGGSGVKPAGGLYVSSSGFTSDITLAVDIRGASGLSGDGLAYNGDPTVIQQDALHRFFTDDERVALAGKQNSLGFTPENSSNKATDLSSNNDVKFPTVKAVVGAIAAITSDTITEGTTKLFLTEARTLATKLTGYVKSVSVRALGVTDTILVAFGIIEKRVSDSEASITSIQTSLGTKVSSSGSVIPTNTIWVGSQIDYDAIATKSNTTLYFIK